MGSNELQLFREDLLCPVCKNPLSSPGRPPKQKINKVKYLREKGCAPHMQNSIQVQRNTRIAVGKFKDNDEITLAKCGHLFHKFCLRHHCYLSRVNSMHTESTHKVACPVCRGSISMTSSYFIDYRAHQGRVTDFDKDFVKTNVMNNELAGQKDSVTKKLRRIIESTEDAFHNLDIYRGHRKKVKQELKQANNVRLDIDNLYFEIEQADKMLAYMQTHHLKIVRRFIAKCKEKMPKEFLHLPKRLAPFLQIIEKDDRLVRNLGEIIVPIQINHLKSDRKSLLSDILSVVNQRHNQLGNSNRDKNVESHNCNNTQLEVLDRIPKDKLHQPNNMPMPSVVVKVRKSSVSILSSSSLTRESIQHIMESVEGPLQVMKRQKKSNKRRTKVMEKFSNNMVESVSASDIKILYMPKRKIIDQVSEPCRTIEGNETSAVKVPVRKCKSTDAVLIKTRKKTQKVFVDPQSQAITKINKKRSNSVTTLPINNQIDIIESNTITKSDLPTTTPVSILPENHTAALPDIHEQMHKTHPSRIDVNNNLADTKELTDLSKDVCSLSPKENEPVSQALSVLELMYESLDEERKSNHKLIKHSQNKGLLINSFGGTDDQGSINDVPKVQSSISNMCPRPTFFRIDGKGFPRPESPGKTVFRLPTFLSTTNISDTFLSKMGCIEPDEENQLEALSPEERYLISKEIADPTNRSAVGNKTEIGLRRPKFHGIPACLGMPNGQDQIHYLTTPSPANVPTYLRKWQQQLKHRKLSNDGIKLLPKQFETSFLSSRLTQAPKRDANSVFKSHVSSGFKFNHMYHDNEALRRSFEPIHLPPLTMFPVKRPSTTECAENLGCHPDVPDCLPIIFNGLR